MAQPLEQSLDNLEKKILPQSLTNLTDRHEHITQVVQYLEGAYLSADQGAEDRALVESRVILTTFLAKSYLTDALLAVVSDINAAAGNLENFVDLQFQAMESLTTNINLVQTQLDLCKEQHAIERLAEMRAPVTASTGIPTKQLKGVEAPENTAPRPEYIRQPLLRRMNKYEDVGVSFSGARDMLQREDSIRGGSGYRRDSYGTQASRSMLQTSATLSSAPPPLSSRMSTSNMN